jgi:hypothetical protein
MEEKINYNHLSTVDYRKNYTKDRHRLQIHEHALETLGGNDFSRVILVRKIILGSRKFEMSAEKCLTDFKR